MLCETLVRLIGVGIWIKHVAALSVFEELREVPAGWKFSRKANNEETIKLRVGVRQQNVAVFEEKLLSISTPGHPNYGHFMSNEDVQAMLQPSGKARDAVLDWLDRSNVSSVQDHSDWISFRATVEQARTMLGTEFSWYRNEYKDLEIMRTLSYSVPESIAGHIDLIQPTTKFINIRPRAAHINRLPWNGSFPLNFLFERSDDFCNTTVTPECLLDLYNIHYGPDPNNGNKLAFASFLDYYARYEDLELFQEDLAMYSLGQNFTVVEFNGGLNNQSSLEPSDEGNLDCQYQVALGYPIPVTEFSTGGLGPLTPDGDEPDESYNSNEPYLEYLMGILNLTDSELPQTISHSYGENEQSVPVSYNNRVCNMFAQLGARGVSVLFSSGDSGVGDYCLSNDGQNKLVFQPEFPAACPWVTAVGGTYQIKPERAIYFSGGGFSRVYDRPSYQDTAVQTYLNKTGTAFQEYYNPNGRAYPDISAQSFNYTAVDKTAPGFYQGTSCSAPTVAAIISMLNSARISTGQKPLGFLNPWLYSEGYKGLNDIVDGGNTGCDGDEKFHGVPNRSPVIPYASFNATEGFDPVTGLGTPDLGKLLALVAPGVNNTGGVLPN